MSDISSSHAASSSRIPYNPVNRSTEASSVLIPLTAGEWSLSRSCANPLRTLHRLEMNQPSIIPIPHARPFHAPAPSSPAHSRSKRSRNDVANSTEGFDEPQQADAKRSRDHYYRPGTANNGAVVAQYYNARPNIDRESRDNSPIIGLKNFNNWIKSVLIAKFGKDGQSPSAKLRSTGLKVLDMGCGKGGDLQKWQRAGVEEYIGVDLASISIEQARSRWSQMRRSTFRADFFALDCYERELSEALRPEQLERPFDVVSMQFCMHYAFETEAKARMMLENVSRHLVKDGYVIGTIPSSENLLSRIEELPEDAAPLTFGNDVYRITFDERDTSPRFGHRYSFFLVDAVEEVPEYVVHWAEFVELASEYDLQVVYAEDFLNIFMQERTTPEFANLLKVMRVVDANDESQMNQDQFDATNLYKGFVLQKLS